MTNATKGLHRALGRAASAAAVAIADLQPNDLLAEMSDEQKTAMAAHFAPTASVTVTDQPAAGAGDPPNDDDDNDDGDPVQPAAAARDPRIKAVAKAVATNDACKGKADVALSLLADDDFSELSASAIVKMVAGSPAVSDPDAAARSEMRAAIASTTNSNVNANDAGSKPDAKAKADSVWDRAFASVDALRAK